MKTCPLCLKRLGEGKHGSCIERLWTAVQRLAVVRPDPPTVRTAGTPGFTLVEDESPEQLRARLESLAAYAAKLRRAHRDEDGIGEICDQIDLRAWGPGVLVSEDED